MENISSQHSHGLKRKKKEKERKEWEKKLLNCIDQKSDLLQGQQYESIISFGKPENF